MAQPIRPALPEERVTTSARPWSEKAKVRLEMSQADLLWPLMVQTLQFQES